MKDFFGYAQVLDTQLIDGEKAGALTKRKGAIATLGPGTLVTLESGDTLEADLVVCATGFKKSYAYLPDDAKAALDVQVCARRRGLPCRRGVVVWRRRSRFQDDSRASSRDSNHLSHPLADPTTLPSLPPCCTPPRTVPTRRAR